MHVKKKTTNFDSLIRSLFLLFSRGYREVLKQNPNI